MDVVVFSAVSALKDDTAMYLRSSAVAPATMYFGTWRTELNITGTGFLHGVWWHEDPYSAKVYVRVTIDGGTPFLVGDQSDNSMSPTGDLYKQGVSVGDVRFKSSLKVEITTDVTATVGSHVLYSLT